MKTTGQFGDFGGVYVSELLIPALQEIEAAFNKYKDDPEFKKELNDLFVNFAGRPTPLTYLPKLSKKYGAKFILKREDLLYGGAHKTNNVLGQALLAKRMGKTELIAETGAGQHGSATAMAGALFGMPVKIFMGKKDIERQNENVKKMRLFGAEVIPVETGSQSLKDAINDALRYWTAHSDDTYYMFGTVAGPHPFPEIVAHFQEVIGREAHQQILDQYGQLPKAVVACIGGGSNAIGIFRGFLHEKDVQIIGVEAGGDGLDTSKHGAALNKGRPGVVHGSYSYVLQDDDGQIHEAHSLSAGLDYPGVGPEHSYLKDSGRAQYIHATDREAVDAFFEISSEEGILAALESSHALAGAKKTAPTFTPDDIILITLSGRGDKDIDHVTAYRDAHQPTQPPTDQ